MGVICGGGIQLLKELGRVRLSSRTKCIRQAADWVKKKKTKKRNNKKLHNVEPGSTVNVDFES